MMNTTKALLILFLALSSALVGCLEDSLELESKDFVCTQDAQCMPGYTCHQGICTKNGVRCGDLICEPGQSCVDGECQGEVQPPEDTYQDLNDMDLDEDQSCCTQTGCNSGFECNQETCQCQPSTCCSEATCALQGQTCNTNTCQCESESCCSEDACAQQGQTCNTLTCQCEGGNPTLCDNVGELCDPTQAQPDGFFCLQLDNKPSYCAETCIPVDADQPQPCPYGQACIDTGGGEGACILSDCTHFFVGDCPSGQKCLHYINGTRLCMNYGAGVEGESCSTHEFCGEDFLCISQSCQTPDCTSQSGTHTCPTGIECFDYYPDDPLDLGACSEECQMFLNQCPGDSWCFPRERDPNTQRIMGTCYDDTGHNTGEGAPCDPNLQNCDNNLICLQFVGDTMGTCLAFCDPLYQSTGVGACPGDGNCIELSTSNGDTMDFGACAPGCTPFPVSMGCGTNEFCFPALRELGKGYCIPSVTGQAEIGEACNPVQCNDGGLCIDPGTGPECYQLCDLQGSTTCPGGTNCIQLSDEEGLLEFGACLPG